MLVSEVIAEVRKIVQVRPETYYRSDNGCKYSEGECSDGSIGCLFGQALSNLGEKVKRFDSYIVPEYGYGTYTPAIGKILEKENITGSEEELTWCDRVQECQDGGMSWKDAVRMADEDIIL